MIFKNHVLTYAWLQRRHGKRKRKQATTRKVKTVRTARRRRKREARKKSRKGRKGQDGETTASRKRERDRRPKPGAPCAAPVEDHWLPDGVRTSICLQECHEYQISRHTPNLPTKIIPILKFVDSNFPGDSLWAWEFHPYDAYDIKIMLESNPLKSRISVQRLAVFVGMQHDGSRRSEEERRPRPQSRRRQPRRSRRPELSRITGFQTGSGQMGFSQEGQKPVTVCHMLLLVRTCCHILPHVATCCCSLPNVAHISPEI